MGKSPWLTHNFEDRNPADRIDNTGHAHGLGFAAMRQTVHINQHAHATSRRPKTEDPDSDAAALHAKTPAEIAKLLAEIEASQSRDNCPAGKFRTQPHYPCNLCPAGKYRTGLREVQCTICPAGTWGSHGATSDQCSGFCNKGSFSEPGLSSCRDCVSGQYSDKEGSEDCLPCPVGRYGLGGYFPVTSIHCTGPCPAGRYGNGASGTMKCDGKCDPGSFSKAGAGGCTLCPAGRYGTEESITSINCFSACPSGKYSKAGAELCITCPAGRSPQVNFVSFPGKPNTCSPLLTCTLTYTY